MPNVLVIANQTLRGRALQGLVHERLEQGVCRFVVAVPVTRAQDLVAVDQYGVPMPYGAVVNLGDLEEAEDQARSRLESLLAEIRQGGAEAEGFLGDADPWTTFKAASSREEFDEVVVSTLEPRISRWLRMDLVSRIERCFDGPVTNITADSM